MLTLTDMNDEEKECYNTIKKQSKKILSCKRKFGYIEIITDTESYLIKEDGFERTAVRANQLCQWEDSNKNEHKNEIETLKQLKLELLHLKTNLEHAENNVKKIKNEFFCMLKDIKEQLQKISNNGRKKAIKIHDYVIDIDKVSFTHVTENRVFVCFDGGMNLTFTNDEAIKLKSLLMGNLIIDLDQVPVSEFIEKTGE